MSTLRSPSVYWQRPPHQAGEAGVGGWTCIACHKCIALELPKDDKDPSQ